MAEWSQSAFLQALGWATLNSFWQMALLWVGYIVLQHLIKLSSMQKYIAALGSLGAGFLWFIYTFFVYYGQGSQGSLWVAQHTMAPTSHTWSILLSSASIAYLLLLVIPAYRLFQNWRYIEHLKLHGLQKTAPEHRLFVQKIAARLGIKKTVHVYISHFINSPVTIGYIKPMILLPIAALNSLTPQQIEAVLLHELSHIKRYDYLINFIVTLLHTVFYFNPFVKKFVTAIDAERENCCDELVLQFEYDKISYASALLTLEKNTATTTVLAMGAAGKSHLLTRIEKIVGLEKKPTLSFNYFAGMMTSILLVIFINSMFFVSKPQMAAKDVAFKAIENPFYAFDVQDVPTNEGPHPVIHTQGTNLMIAHTGAPSNRLVEDVEELISEVPQPDDEPSFYLHASYNPLETVTGTEEKAQIKQTVEATKKVITNAQWVEVEKSIADGMTPSEKELAKQEYLREMEQIDWEKLENKLKIDFQKMNWNKINSQLQEALVTIQLDSMHKAYTDVLVQLEKAETKSKTICPNALAIPDASVEEVRIIKDDIRQKIDSIKIIKAKKVVNL